MHRSRHPAASRIHRGAAEPKIQYSILSFNSLHFHLRYYYTLKSSFSMKNLLFVFFFFLSSAVLLYAQQSDGYNHGIINIKLTSAGFEKLNVQKTAEGILKTNIDEQLDASLKKINATALIPALPASSKFAERHKQFGLNRWFTIEFSAKMHPREAVSIINKSSFIEFAEPDYKMELFGPAVTPFPNDSLLHKQWQYSNTGLHNGMVGADISMFEAWTISTGTPNVIVHVADSGIITQLPEFINMLWVNPEPGSFGEGIENDTHGWNFRGGDNNLEDTNGHGTHVAGIVAAESNNGYGIAGVAGGDGSGNGVRLMIGKLFEGTSGSTNAQTLQSFVYAADNGAVISNNSWGYQNPGFMPFMVRNGIDYFIENAGYDLNGEVTGPMAGGVVIFASGNSNSDELFYPGAYEPVINVAATDNRDQKALYSNFGSHIDISAPGGRTSPVSEGGILSTDLSSRGLFHFRQGTSMAAPHVAGVSALMASHFPNLTNTELIERLLSTTDDIEAQNPGYESQLGTGRLNAYKALTTNSPPALPRLSTPVNGEVDVQPTVTLSWNAVPMAESYQLQISRSEDFSPAELLFDLNGIPTNEQILQDLQLERDYYWRVRGINEFGEGLWSAVFTFTTTDRPPPASPELLANYPNPFNPSTTIEFGLPESMQVNLSIYDITGRLVGVLQDGELNTGWHRFTFNAAGLASGVYIYRLRTDSSNQTGKMLLVK